MATRTTSAGSTMWSAMFAASAMLISTPFTRPVKALSRAPYNRETRAPL
jgi:hypothetical protein